MKKIGIVSELNLENVNYGNRLQAFALNYYINNSFKMSAESIIFNNVISKKITNNYLVEYSKKTIKYILNMFTHSKRISRRFETRLSECNRFTRNNTDIRIINNKLEINQYDYMIVGSDVVWAQSNNSVNKIKFLDFNKASKFNKISYAASFGKNWIPDENKKYINEQLKKFKNISVRENKSVELLKDIGINDAEHVCDPTLLLDKEEWKIKEKTVESIGNNKYIFVYLLGKNKEQREIIKKYAKECGYLIVDIPNANMEYNEVDENFADISIDDCSPEQWLWLIDNSQFIFTDSFHGCVFANIFEKKFIIFKREYSSDINIRMTDFLEYIDEKDKFLTPKEFEKNIENANWNYIRIKEKLEELIGKSKEFLERALDIKE